MSDALRSTVEAYSCRDRDTGEEFICFDPPGGVFRDLGDEYVSGKVMDCLSRDRRDGYWKNGVCVVFRPEGDVRKKILEISLSVGAPVISVPRLDRTLVFADGYEIIEDGSLDGWLVWQWCMANAKGTWEWVNLGTDGGPWLTFNSLRDHLAFMAAFPELAA